MRSLSPLRLHRIKGEKMFLSFSNIKIPKDWTGNQAKVIIEFLDEISTAIWNLYEDSILIAIQIDNNLSKIKDDKKTTITKIEDNIFPF